MMAKNKNGIIPTRKAFSNESKKVGRFHLLEGTSKRNAIKYTEIPIPASIIKIEIISFNMVHS
jgi:hypothetical protein